MADEQKDLNTGQLVADPDLNKNQSVAGTDLNVSGQDEPGKLADGTDENKTVKYSEFKKANDAKVAAEELLEKQRQDHINQIAILQANPQPTQTQTQPLSDYDQAKLDVGIADAEYLTEVERSKVQSRLTEIANARSQQSAVALTNQQFELSHSDFGSVVGLRNPVNGQIQATAEIQKILTEQPHLVATAYASSKGAYEIVMKERKITELQKAKDSTQEHQKRIDDATQPLGGSAAGGVAGDANNQQMMTREQVLEIERKLANDETV